MAKLKKTGEVNMSSQAVMGTIGERLKSARENKGLSLDDVYRIIKIHPKTLEALEKGRLEDKLGAAYVKAFLKNYSAFLGMDADKVTAEYNSKKRSQEPRKEEFRKIRMADKKKESSGKNNQELLRAVTTLAIFLVILAAVAFGAVKTSQFAKNAFSKVRTRTVSNKKSEPAKESPKPAAARAQTAAESIVPIPKERMLTLTLITSNDVWLKVIVDGKVAFHRILSKKSKETWKAEKEIRLAEIGKPEALAMNVNGKDIDFSKIPVRNILITREGVDLEPK